MKNNFPEQYNIANNMEASVAELLSFSAGNYHWNINFIQPVQDWELELVVSFMDLIFSGSLRRNVTYKICWKLLPRGTFDVRSYYKALQLLNSFSFTWKPLWKPNVPKRLVSLFGQRHWEKF